MTNLFGVYSGIVVSVDDPQHRSRVRLQIPQVTGTAVSGWAESVTGGLVMVGDRVTVAFDGADPNYPVYWPRAVSAWQPLELEDGWTASWQGDPVFRTTQDGMVELAGSVETSSSIALGAPVPFAQLPQAAHPMDGFHAPAAMNYATAYDARLAVGHYVVTTTTASTSWVTMTGGPTAEFVAPVSGQVAIIFGAFIQSSTDTGRSLMSVRVHRGSTLIFDGDDNGSAEVQGPDNTSASMARMLFGLTPGATHTATGVFRTDTASNTATFDNKWISVFPVGTQDSPTTRVQLQNNGLVVATIPPGASPPYNVSLTGIRARIV
ncbi:phage baseplate assembly protein V [Streptomyces sp. NPDC017260]|uniref:phage baseplate assembly protein V n=1 Tax=unclassified Streptomyces TaxID=2593676 RepID=UPI0037A82E25